MTQKPLAQYYLSKLPKRSAVVLTLYDLCWLAPFASEARVRFAIRELMIKGHAYPEIVGIKPGEDERCMWRWTLTRKAHVLYDGDSRYLLGEADWLNMVAPRE